MDKLLFSSCFSCWKMHLWKPGPDWFHWVDFLISSSAGWSSVPYFIPSLHKNRDNLSCCFTADSLLIHLGLLSKNWKKKTSQQLWESPDWSHEASCVVCIGYIPYNGFNYDINLAVGLLRHPLSRFKGQAEIHFTGNPLSSHCSTMHSEKGLLHFHSYQINKIERNHNFQHCFPHIVFFGKGILWKC